ncbi:MAG: CotH kinase family protein [Cyclobacteriaceae bacterium]|nr:CotH kinase family protein [Cyclobacteriaceae bacterium]
MRRSGLFILLYLVTSLIVLSHAFAQVNHWEAVVNASNTWKYSIGTNEPPVDWINLTFDDSSWLEGPGGIGYGDGDDGTTISATVSTVYLRKKFTVYSIAEIEQAVLLADYDDGFVAYLNGKEIARAGISGTRPTYNQFAEIDHEATLYQGFYPMERVIKKSDISEWLINGDNILSVQIHNLNATSSDLSSNFFLNVALNVANLRYQPVQSWFVTPANYNSSNLPLVILDTQGADIPNEPKIFASMGIIDNGPGMMNSIDDPITGYQGNIAIEIRGSSSQSFPKKQYAIELKSSVLEDTSAVILGMPKEEDWILQGPYSDKSLIRNVLIYKLSNDLGWYAPRTVLCEVFLNGQYRGVYFMTEKIKRDKGRVNISDLNVDENTGDDLTGGYIVKIDKFDGATAGLGWDSPYPSISGSQTGVIHFQYHYPAEDVITTSQGNYIRQYVTSFETALQAPYFRDPNKGYRKYINVDSFIDFAICNEITKNVDGYRLSTFMHKDKDSKDGKLYMGPIWDFNLGFGNADYCNGWMTSGWAWDFNDYCGNDYWSVPFWWKKLLRDPDYQYQFKERWSSLRQNVLSNDAVLGYIDSVVMVLEEPQKRNFAQWPILNQYVWPNSYVGGSYASEIGFLKNWISERFNWLDNTIGSMTVVTGLTDMEYHDISVYPNPSNGKFNIQFGKMPFGEVQVEILDNLGRMQLSERLHFHSAESTHEIEARLQSGVYFIRIMNEKQLIHTQKIVVN